MNVNVAEAIMTVWDLHQIKRSLYISTKEEFLRHMYVLPPYVWLICNEKLPLTLITYLFLYSKWHRL